MRPIETFKGLEGQNGMKITPCHPCGNFMNQVKYRMAPTGTIGVPNKRWLGKEITNFG